MRLTRWTMLLVAITPACALVSGLSSLDVDGRDASSALDGATANDAASTDATAQDSSPDVAVVFDSGGDAPVDPGSLNALRCGPKLNCNVNTQTCCSVQGATSCTNGTAATCGTSTAITIHCDHGLHCKPGEVCCGKVGGSSGSAACTSVSGCFGADPAVRLCRTASECPDGGKCTPLPDATTVPWLNYCN